MAVVMLRCLQPADFYMSLYNVLFTVLPPMIVGIFDQDVSKDLSLRYPGVDAKSCLAILLMLFLHALAPLQALYC